MRTNKFLAGLLASVMVLTTPIAVMAADTQNVTSASTVSANVTYSQDSTFTVTIPKSITIDGTSKQASYEVKIAGDIAGNDRVTVTTSADVSMTDSHGKAAVTATNDLTSVFLAYEAGTTSVTRTGNITASGLSAGVWTGTMTFTIAKTTN